MSKSEKEFFGVNEENFLFNHWKYELRNPEDLYLHTHNVPEIIYIVEADGCHIAEDREYPLRSGDLIIVPPATYHGIKLNKPSNYERYDICFNHKLIQDIDTTKIFKNIEVINCKRNSIIDGIFKKADYYASCFSGEQFINLSIMLLNEIFYNLSVYNGTEVAPTFFSPTLSKAIDYINNNLFDIKSVSEISENIFVTEGYLYEVFKSQLNISPKKYINSKRLHYAAREICMGEKPSEIYLKAGFEDYTSFYRSFKKFFGFPPSNALQHGFTAEKF